MDANVLNKAKDLAKEIATQPSTLEELNGAMRSLMKSALERMLSAELRVHLDEEAKETSAAIEGSAEDARLAPGKARRHARNRVRHGRRETAAEVVVGNSTRTNRRDVGVLKGTETSRRSSLEPGERSRATPMNLPASASGDTLDLRSTNLGARRCRRH